VTQAKDLDMVASNKSYDIKDYEAHPLFALGVPILQKHFDKMREAMEEGDIMKVAMEEHSLTGLDLYAMAYSFKTLLDINQEIISKKENDGEEW